MNLTGAQLYSRASTGLRRPGSKLLDNQFNLSFIYPILIDSKLQGKYGNTIRSFIAVSMLKEIFVSNALNIVTLASKDHPLIDEQGKQIDMAAMVQKSVSSYAGISGDTEEINISSRNNREIDPYVLQNKINEKTATIKKYLSTEPRLKKLNSYVEIITLDNMIDVPVIVGTKDYQINTLTLAFVLAVSIAFKKPLDTLTNVNYIFNVIQNMKQDDAWSLFNNMTEKTQSKMSERIVNYINDTLPPSIASKLQKYIGYITTPMERFSSAKKSASKFIGGTIGPYIPSRGKRGELHDPEKLRHSQEIEFDARKGVYRDTKDPSKEYDPRSFGSSASKFDILSVVQDDLSQAHLFFKFMLDDELLRSQFGLRKSPGQMKTMGSKVSEFALNLLDQSSQTFMTYLNRNLDGLLRSSFSTIAPIDANISYLKIKSMYITQNLNQSIKQDIDDLGDMLYSSFISVDPDTAKKRTKIINKLCETSDISVFIPIKKVSQILNSIPISSSSFDLRDLEHFSGLLSKASSECNSVSRTITNLVEKAVPGIDSLMKDVVDQIQSSLDGMFDEYERFYTSDDTTGVLNRFSNVAIFKNKRDDGITPMVDPKDIGGYINELKLMLVEIISSHFLASIVPSICGFTDHLEVEVETVINDALDLPNYTLVLPVETVAMLHSAVVSKTWRNLIESGNTQNTNLNDNYIKGIVKFIHKRINVPNLIVIDSRNNQVFYKLQYMSQVNKSTIRVFETYIQHLTKEELSASSSQY